MYWPLCLPLHTIIIISSTLRIARSCGNMHSKNIIKIKCVTQSVSAWNNTLMSWGSRKRNNWILKSPLSTWQFHCVEIHYPHTPLLSPSTFCISFMHESWFLVELHYLPLSHLNTLTMFGVINSSPVGSVAYKFQLSPFFKFKLTVSMVVAMLQLASMHDLKLIIIFYVLCVVKKTLLTSKETNLKTLIYRPKISNLIILK